MGVSKEFPSPVNGDSYLAVDAMQVRYLARQIQDAAQFDAIVGQITDPHMRLEVKRLLLPLLKFTYQPACACSDETSETDTNPPICRTCHKEKR